MLEGLRRIDGAIVTDADGPATEVPDLVVAKRRTPFFGVVNAGVMAFPVSNSRIEIVRLIDGLGWSLEGEPGVPFMDGIWINAQSVWMAVSNAPVGSPYYPTFGGIMRLARPSEPTTLPNGL